MSYTNTINNTRTQTHSIVPTQAKEQSFIQKVTNAQGTGITGSAIRKVAEFIGMDALAQPEKTQTTLGMLSVDLELANKEWRSSFAKTSALEEAERSRRMNDKDEEVKKSRSFVLAKSILQSIQSPKFSTYDRVVSKRFLAYARKNVQFIEESERQRRQADTLGETFRRDVARETSKSIFEGLQYPSLRATPQGWTRRGMLSDTLGTARWVAQKKFLPAAESFAIAAYQIGDFAARAAYFFGGKAASKAQDLSHQAAVQGPAIGHQAATKAAEIGLRAASNAQELGHRAVEGAHGLSNKAYDLGHKAQDLTHQAVAGVQNWGAHASEKAQEIKENITDSVNQAISGPEWAPSTLSWQQLSSLEETERKSRLHAQFGSNRFGLAMRVSSLIKDQYRGKSEADSAWWNSHYGTAILEETERIRRITAIRYDPSPKINARRTASMIKAYRNKWLAQQQSSVAPDVCISSSIVKQAQAPLQTANVRHVAAM